MASAGVALSDLQVIPTSFPEMAQEQACNLILASELYQRMFFFGLPSQLLEATLFFRLPAWADRKPGPATAILLLSTRTRLALWGGLEEGESQGDAAGGPGRISSEPPY